MNASSKTNREKGFSLIELIITMTIMLIALSIVSSIVFRSFGVRARESRTSDALVSAQAALSVMSREISNAGFGLYNSDRTTANNGIIIPDSNATSLRIQSNLDNSGGVPLTPGPTTLAINLPGEDVRYFFDQPTFSIVRYDPNGGGTGVPKTSVVVNKISNVEFQYFDYTGSTATPVGPLTAPTADTGRVKIIVEVKLDPVPGQPSPASVKFASEVALRNCNYMRFQY